MRVRGYQFGLAGHITNNWQVFGGYTYMDGTVLKALDSTRQHARQYAAQHDHLVDEL